MRIAKFRILNFKGFRDSGWLDLSDRFNVVVGQNNAGKSALLEAFQLSRGSNQPHRSELRSDPHEVDPKSKFQLHVEISWDEWVDAMRASGEPISIQTVNNESMTADLHLKAMIEKLSPSLLYEAEVSPSGSYRSLRKPIHGMAISPPQSLSIQIAPDKSAPTAVSVSNNKSDQLFQLLPEIERRNIVLMDAQRAIDMKVVADGNQYLTANASNLPSVVSHILNTAPNKYARLLSDVQEIFPDISRITAPRADGPGGTVEIRLWFGEAQEKPSQGISLSDSGTGVAQVLSILYVAQIYDSAIIIIDEINSFLHPTALKNLLRILRTRYAHHQYIISTHSMDVISWTNPERVFLTKKIGREIAVDSLDVSDVSALRELAGNLGVEMADVFAADRLIWVEGETEEICFPTLIRASGMQIPRGTVITSVMNTGDFSGRARDVTKAFAIYDKISKLAAPLIVDAKFSLDREGLSAAEVVELEARSGGALKVLPRRMLENYAIHVGAISSLLISLGIEADEENVSDWLNRNCGDQKYKASTQWKEDFRDAAWLTEVDGSRLLGDLVSDLSHTTFEFRKTSHTPWLFDWICQNELSHLEELSNYLHRLLEIG